MGFKKYKTTSDVLNAYQISIEKAAIIKDCPKVDMPEVLKIELDYVMENLPYKVSEASIREMIMFPILKEVWRKYDDTLMLWANKTIFYDKELTGIPDYIITKQSHLGKTVFGKPLMAVVEAKKDDFEGGWAQCLLEMYTIQRMNNNEETPIFGIVSNGHNWEFGRLQHQLFTDNKTVYNIEHKDALFSAIACFFELCRLNMGN